MAGEEKSDRKVLKNRQDVGKKEPTLLDESVTYTFTELCNVCKVGDEFVFEMINEGIIAPIRAAGASPRSWMFSATNIKKVQMTVRLQEDLRVNLPGAALAIELLEELEQLRNRVGEE
ncbi:chaperone modulator CbpM [Desulfosediminicola ganghwensis]|uniref:chaperone modulator CbpM n=1 Tax=Desulfosediminicola ganghwensis TaxID=2569540 RepID=UPI0010ABDC49|nr:chaperone modulator CbpM [Desulfosediminicola ganghwensis]